jgi:hypothetical protein
MASKTGAKEWDVVCVDAYRPPYSPFQKVV